MSCNGCRVLRKGCSESCVLRPCLHWISTAESQANATIFLAKFYGRAGLTNLISNGPEHLRPVIFRSLLYEACGRMINPEYGSVGLLWSGNWAQCEAGVDNVLRGSFCAIPEANFIYTDREDTVAIKAIAVPQLRRSVKARDRLMGISHAKRKRKEGESRPNRNHINSSDISDDLSDVRNALQTTDNGKFYEKGIEKYSRFKSGREHDEFLADDLCSLITNEPKVAGNTVGLELTLCSQGSTSPHDKLSSQ